MLKSQIHPPTVSKADLDYIGSITISPIFLEASGIGEFEKVQIVNIKGGARIDISYFDKKRGCYLFKRCSSKVFSVKVKGIDASEKMIYYANLLNSGNLFIEKNIDLVGFKNKKMKFPSYNKKNILFERAPYGESMSCMGQYDIITNVNYLDRCGNIPQNISRFYSDLKTGGVLIGATPLNFRGQKAYANAEIRKIFKSCGFVEEIFFDGLPYYEIMDSRKSGELYSLICFKYRKSK